VRLLLELEHPPDEGGHGEGGWGDAEGAEAVWAPLCELRLGHGEGDVPGKERVPGECWMTEGGEEVVHSLYSRNEADPLFEVHEVLMKQRRQIEMRHGETPFIVGYIDYIVGK